MGNSRYKFRAWDKENKVMVYPKGVLFDGRVVNFSCGMLEPFEGYELMQYTGLKDKNGKEIYEQDILEVESFEGSKSVVRVVFDDGCFCHVGYLGDLRTYPLRELLFNGSRIQVIGNIFQDGDLLRDS